LKTESERQIARKRERREGGEIREGDTKTEIDRQTGCKSETDSKII
jgi:hypothetical protein